MQELQEQCKLIESLSEAWAKEVRASRASEDAQKELRENVKVYAQPRQDQSKKLVMLLGVVEYLFVGGILFSEFVRVVSFPN
jgi:hypothetical protein